MAKKTTPLTSLILYMTVILLSLIFVTGCGKKDWPNPVAKEDRFEWKKVRGQREGNCLRIKAIVQGNINNLAKIVLELEEAKEICQGCPFSANDQMAFSLNAPEVEQQGSKIHIYCCPFQGGQEYRWRLRGINTFYAIKDVISDIHISK